VRRVLLDENLPRKLGRELSECIVRTVQEEGWGSFKNGALLSRAQTSFDVFLSADSHLKDQQNVARFDIGIVIIRTVSLRLRVMVRAIEEIRAAVVIVRPGELIEVEMPRPRRL
jgi:predicted nuclease of predicted toxin-antitoxin system